IRRIYIMYYFFFQAEDGIRDFHVTGVQTCALPICSGEQGRQLHGVPATASRCRARARQPEISSIASTACPFGLETFGRQPVTQQIGRASCRERVKIAVSSVSRKTQLELK